MTESLIDGPKYAPDSLFDIKEPLFTKMLIENNFNWNSYSQRRITYWNSVGVNSKIQEQLVIGHDLTDVSHEVVDQAKLMYEL